MHILQILYNMIVSIIVHTLNMLHGSAGGEGHVHFLICTKKWSYLKHHSVSNIRFLKHVYMCEINTDEFNVRLTVYIPVKYCQD